MSETKEQNTKNTTNADSAAGITDTGSAVILRPRYALSRVKTSNTTKTNSSKSTSPKSPNRATVPPASQPAKSKKPARTIEITTPKPQRTSPTKSPNNTHSNPKTDNTTKAKHKKKMKLPFLRKIHIKPTYIVSIIIVAVLAIFFGRVALWEHGYFDRMEGSDRDTPASNGTSGVIYDGGDDVDETEPTENEVTNYIVAPEMPRYFSIPSLGIKNALVTEVGLRPDGAVDVPRNAFMIGWYNGSVLPGKKGTALLDAHGGDLGNGIFRTLPRIQVGADINIEMGDGRLYTYKVVNTATRPLDGANNADQYMPTALTSPQPGAASLTLITCTGEWSQVRQTYLDRFFVRAVLQQ